MKQKANVTLKYEDGQKLTERELQIVTLLARGYSNKQISDHLEISEWTVSSYLRRIFAKAGVTNRAAMVYQCSRQSDLT